MQYCGMNDTIIFMPLKYCVVDYVLNKFEKNEVNIIKHK